RWPTYDHLSQGAAVFSAWQRPGPGAVRGWTERGQPARRVARRRGWRVVEQRDGDRRRRRDPARRARPAGLGIRNSPYVARGGRRTRRGSAPRRTGPGWTRRLAPAHAALLALLVAQGPRRLRRPVVSRRRAVPPQSAAGARPPGRQRRHH